MNKVTTRVEQSLKLTLHFGESRYELLAIQFARPTSCGRLGVVDSNGWLIVCGPTGYAHLFQGSGGLHMDYVGEKLGLRGEDAWHVTDMICQATGRENISGSWRVWQKDLAAHIEQQTAGNDREEEPRRA